jgi:hypothetical protein
MKYSLTRNMIGFVAVAVVLFGSASWGANPDPYAVIDKFVAANGGLANMEAIKTMHSRGSLTIIGAGISGTFEQWSETPLKTRQEVDLKIFKQVGGDSPRFGHAQGAPDQGTDGHERPSEQNIKRVQGDF